MALRLLESAITFSVFDESDHHTWGHCIGEISVHFDDVDVAWVRTCDRLRMTEEVIQHLAGKLRPLGVKWMRGWGDGGREGRVLTANGPITCEPWSEIYDAGEDDDTRRDPG